MEVPKLLLVLTLIGSGSAQVYGMLGLLRHFIGTSNQHTMISRCNYHHDFSHAECQKLAAQLDNRILFAAYIHQQNDNSC